MNPAAPRHPHDDGVTPRVFPVGSSGERRMRLALRLATASSVLAASAASLNASTASKPYTPNALALSFPMYFR